MTAKERHIIEQMVVNIRKGELLYKDIPDGYIKDEIKILLDKGDEPWS
jgi:hypothetical protein